MPATDDSSSLAPVTLPGGGLERPPAVGWPSPSIDGLSLERISSREAAYLGHVFGVDTPYVDVPLGWGEREPITGGTG